LANWHVTLLGCAHGSLLLLKNFWQY
jgi:hypothetical protein